MLPAQQTQNNKLPMQEANPTNRSCLFVFVGVGNS